MWLVIQWGEKKVYDYAHSHLSIWKMEKANHFKLHPPTYLLNTLPPEKQK